MSKLEENAKKILVAFHKGEIPILGPIAGAVDLTDKKISEAANHLEEKNYWEIIGGTPKSGIRYGITEEGLKYIGVEK